MNELATKNAVLSKQEKAIAKSRTELATAPAVSTLAKAVKQKGDIARQTMEKAAEAACALDSIVSARLKSPHLSRK